MLAVPRQGHAPRSPSSREDLFNNAAAILFLLAVVLIIVSAYAIEHREEPFYGLLPVRPWGKLVILSATLTGLLLVARWYKRLGSNSDIDELRKAAYAYRLGGTRALRPFLTEEGAKLTADSTLEAYNNGIHEPRFLRVAQTPPFVLALTLVLSLGLLAFYAEDLQIAASRNLLLAGPAAARELPQASGLSEALIKHQLGAMICVTYALAGALIWSIAYLARRMALRDVTPHTYQTITVRIVASAVVALFLFQLLGSEGAGGALEEWLGVGEPALNWASFLVLLAFAAGMVPEVVLRYLDARVRRWFGQTGHSDQLDLETIEGIDAQTRVRLAEVGIYDAQGLITANPLHLTLKTPFSLPQIMDWVGQAFLFVQLKRPCLDALRGMGIRTAWQIRPNSAPLDLTLPGGGVRQITCPDLLATFEQDPCFVRAHEIVERMCGCDAARRPLP